MKRKCYFFNVGTIFDKDDKKLLKDCWNCNEFCCKADLCNGLWCEEYGIDFNKEDAEDYIKNYVINGVEKTYGFIKEKEIDLDKEIWDDIENNLKKNYKYSEKEIKEQGFIPYDYGDIIDEYSSYWEQPDISYLKENDEILINALVIKEQNELNQGTISWINKELYNEQVVEKENVLH